MAAYQSAIVTTRARANGKRCMGLPSWVPDWRCRLTNNKILSKGGGGASHGARESLSTYSSSAVAAIAASSPQFSPPPPSPLPFTIIVGGIPIPQFNGNTLSIRLGYYGERCDTTELKMGDFEDRTTLEDTNSGRRDG